MTRQPVKNSQALQSQPMAFILSFPPAGWWVLAALLGVCFRAVGQPAVKTLPIALRAALLPFTPREYYIADLVDEREDRTAVAYLLPTNSQPAYAVDLQGGALIAIREFIQQSLSRNTALRPIIIRLKECRITESPAATGGVDGRVALGMAFDFQREGELVHLVDYQGGARYNRPTGQLTAVEPALRQSLATALRYLNTWMDRQASSNEKLARQIKVFFTDHTLNVEDDTVFYAPNRLLTWEDFRDKPHPGKYAASVFPSFAYEGHRRVVEGVVQLHLKLKVFVLKDYSWVSEGTRNTHSLNHEQRHFDIVKLVGERFKQKIQPDSLMLGHYDSMIQYQYIESFREMNHLQQQYDEETRHGLDQAAQERWNRRIDEELHTFGVKE